MTILLGMFYINVIRLTVLEFIWIKFVLNVLSYYMHWYCSLFNVLIYLFFTFLFEVIFNPIFSNILFYGVAALSVLKPLFCLLFYTLYIFLTYFIFFNFLYYYKNTVFDLTLIEISWILIFSMNEFFGFCFF